MHAQVLAPFDRPLPGRPRDAGGLMPVLRADSAAALEARGDALRQAGDLEPSAHAYLASVAAAAQDEALIGAAVALQRGALADAQARLRGVLRARPTSIAAIRLMAMLALRLGRHDDALALLGRALELAPGFAPAREMRARLLQQINRFEAALADVVVLRNAAPGDPSHAMLHAALCVRLGRQTEAAAIYAESLAAHPENATGWLSYGHVLKAIGEVAPAVAAYRRAIAARAGYGEAWWSLANLKTVAFAEADLAAMAQALATAQDDEDRLHLHFALGKAYEDRGAHAEAFAAIDAGNRLRRAALSYDPARLTAHVDAWLAALGDGAMPVAGVGDAGPVFVVGLPRSGSTLVEQILASHPAIEGTSELPGMMMIGERLAEEAASLDVTVPTLLARKTAAERAALGAEYLAMAAAHRHEDKPLFIDKMPNNWQHVALIRAILPGARIVDVRRHPMSVGWSCYKQHFARGQEFTYDLADIGAWYRDYVRLMAAFDAAAPGAVHRVIYEDLVADTEGQVRALLAGLGLAFDPACLAFWANRRVVRTPSSEQVRRPVYAGGIDHWQHFEPWLGALRSALGDLETIYKTKT